MKRLLNLFVWVMIILLNTSSLAMSQDHGNFDKQWKKAENLIKQGMPRSALELVDVIYDRAVKEENQPHQLKAYIYRIRLISNFEEDYMEKIIKQIDQDIEKAPQPAKSVFHSIKAELLYSYLQGNRYKILDRTEVLEDSSNDIQIWTLNKFQNTIRSHYLKSLEEKELLVQTPLSDYKLILEEHMNTKQYYPSLYDLLANRAIDALTDDSWDIQFYPFGMDTDQKECYQVATAFIKFKLTEAFNSNRYHVLKIFQELSVTHLELKNEDALIDLELNRINWLKEVSINPERENWYLNFLINLIDLYPENKEIARAYYQIAAFYNKQSDKYNAEISIENRDDLAESVKWCNAAINKYPGSYGALQCELLKNNIMNSSLSIEITRGIIPNTPTTALLSYRNSEKIFFRIVKEDQLIHEYNYGNREDFWNSIKDLEIVKTWQFSPENTGDYRQHHIQIEIPALPLGHYRLLISNDGNFSWNNSIVGEKEFWVSNLAFTKRKNGPQLEILVMNRTTGLRIADANIKIWKQTYDRQSRTYRYDFVKEVSTNKQGSLFMDNLSDESYGTSYIFELIKSDDRFASDNFYYYRHSEREQPWKNQGYLFTDRSIYRPGQTIYFKGILYEKKDHDVKIRPNAKDQIKLYDVNNKELASLNVRSNDYGSYQGSFVLPQGLLTGQFRLKSDHSSVYVRVEEYKRPQFEVLIDTLKGQYEIGDSVLVTGLAKAFAGYAVSDAKVNYRVSMQTRIIKPWEYWRYPIYQPEIDIASGNALTDKDGHFELNFKAHRYPDIAPDSDIKHEYHIYADVTDINGESQSGEGSLGIGGPSLVLDVNIPDVLDVQSDLDFRISSVNTENQPDHSKGTITIYRLESEDRILLPYAFSARPDVFSLSKEDFVKKYPYDIYANEDNIQKQELDKKVFSFDYNTADDTNLDLSKAVKWKEGYYRLIIETKDSKEKEIKTEKNFLLIDSDSDQMPIKQVLWFKELKTKAEPGETAELLIGSSLKTTFQYELEHGGKIIHLENITLKNKQRKIIIPIKESYRGDVFVHLTTVVENRVFQERIRIQVPYSNKKLDITLSTFRNKIIPGSEEEWSVSIKNYKKQAIAAELMACMYDASLDKFLPHSWNMNLYSTNTSSISLDRDLCFITSRLNIFNNIEKSDFLIPQRIYPSLNWFGFRLSHGYGYHRIMKSEAMALQVIDGVTVDYDEDTEIEEMEVPLTEYQVPPPPISDLPEQKQSPQPRRDFRETAFFFPQLYTNDKGEVVFKFKSPEALTRWKFMALAHTKDLEYGVMTQDDIVTSKDLMVVPNAPRFFREGDQMSFQAKVVNLSDTDLKATVKLEFYDAVNMQPVSEQILVNNSEQTINVPAGQSTAVEFAIQIPEGMVGLTYRITASTGAFTDGEEKIIPVLPNRMMVTETLPLWANANDNRSFELENLLNSNKAKGNLQHYKLTLELTSNPVWYAVQSLPYLMEYPHECNEQIFSRYYANALASHIANSNPEIRRVFEVWKNYQPQALMSALEKNQELKNIILEASPWIQQAGNETEQKRRIGLLFDMVRMSSQLQLAQQKLQDNQLESGAWSWFGKKWASRYITTHIVNGFAKLDHLGVIDLQKDYQLKAMLNKALKYLDQEMNTSYNWIMENHKNPQAYVPSSLDVINLYMRSFYNQDYKLKKDYQKAYDFFFKQTEKFWLKKNKYQQGMIALIMHRSGNEKLAQQIIKSLKEHALYKEELGMSWRDFESGGMFWSQAKIESQSMIIEAFEEVANDRKSVDEMRKWLLKNKQTNNWGTTKATVEAIYALLLRGTDQLSTTKLVDVKLGGKMVEQNPSQAEAGTGYFKTFWDSKDIKPKMAKVEINNPNNNPVWGGLYWQYYQDLDFIKEQNTALSIDKELYVERPSYSGPQIKPVNEEEIQIGDKLIVRVIIRTDRDMEYVHLQDMRASGLEPLEVLSGYKFKDGLWYYQSMRDASANFFFDHLPRGTYVFEYSLRVSQKGSFSNGISSIQCMYAPEFSAHSSGERIEIK